MGHVARRIILIGLCALGIGGCTAPRGPLAVDDPDLDVKIPAIKKVVRTSDYSQAKELVEQLDSDDPAVRFYAITGLHRLSGKSFGYRYYDEDDARKPAVEKWKAWLAQRNVTTRYTADSR